MKSILDTSSSRNAENALQLRCGRHLLDLSFPRVMGILNVTPDSFSDGGQHVALDDALRHAERMLAEGAAMIDVGGESTRPGATPVSPQEELDRVAPVVEVLVRELDALVSVDTSCPTVIREVGLLSARRPVCAAIVYWLTLVLASAKPSNTIYAYSNTWSLCNRWSSRC
jgi:dihydropteroate synthase